MFFPVRKRNFFFIPLLLFQKIKTHLISQSRTDAFKLLSYNVFEKQGWVKGSERVKEVGRMGYFFYFLVMEGILRNFAFLNLYMGLRNYH